MLGRLPLDMGPRNRIQANTPYCDAKAQILQNSSKRTLSEQEQDVHAKMAAPSNDR